MKLIRMKCKDDVFAHGSSLYSKEEIAEMGRVSARRFGRNPSINFEREVRTKNKPQFTKEENKIYREAALAELRKMKVIDGKNNDKNYVAYVVTPQMKILSGWEYSEDAKDNLNEWKEGGATGLKIYSPAFLKSKGVDVNNDANWTNRP